MSAVFLPLAALVVVLVVGADDGLDARWWTAAILGGALVAAVAVTALRIASQVSGYVGELERSRQEFRQALGSLGEVLASSHDRRALLEVVLETTHALLRADAAVLYIDSGNHLTARIALGADMEGRRVEHGDGLVGWVAAYDEPVRWPPSARAPGAAEPPATTAIAVPLHGRGRLYGVLALYGRGGRRFTPGELDDVGDLARQADAAIENTYLHEEARRLSLTDGLTGIWNRRQFDLRCSQEVERATRFGERFALVMCDIDDFKLINDDHGHPIGDAVLIEVARRLVETTREVDLVARYGGEEFALVLPQTDRAGAERVAEKVRAAVAGRPIDTDAGTFHVTISAGVACHPDHGESVPALVHAADAALYQAKAAGKNTVRSALVSGEAAS